MDLQGLKFLVVGAGFYGSVIARKIAEELEENVLVIDQRMHIGGNSYSEIDPQTGIEVHTCGSHIFHTSNSKVMGFLKPFMSLNGYRHRVLTCYRNQIYSMPINLMTINSFFKKNFSPEEAQSFLRGLIQREKITNPANLEDKAVSLIGRELYEAFIKGYTAKQWQTSPRELPADIITRLPVRYSYSDRYFSDVYEGIPLEGYGRVFKKMLKHPLISLQLGVDFMQLKSRIPADTRIVYSGPIDRFYNYRMGRLGWRSARFEKECFEKDDFQGTSVMNYADEEIPHLRIHEFKHFHPERQYSGRTIIFKEYAKSATENDALYYPVNTENDKKLFKKYERLAEKENKVLFGGRLGKYVYADMHQVIEMALHTFETKIRNKNEP
ncbi:MAG: UDP-galactopyranose mutase [Deltaproteobacteria bacterium]|nr:UDP-galactopyranose mutase [Deltaproteobacteria bacterium]